MQPLNPPHSVTLNESMVEDVALKWFLHRQGYAVPVWELGYAVGHRAAFAELQHAKPPLAPGEPAVERNRSAAEMDEVNSVGEVGCLRDAVPRLNPAIPEVKSGTSLKSLN